ncbi:MAG: permease-like cell division protein FtsX [Gammaproteobacteria bacterium]|nr:permease-like cell division protein FtsX [Gammaproteobacteria bacterium]MDE2250963.1 permease-like cell division protein FtsX [Gammaproteobacteria bacterium]
MSGPGSYFARHTHALFSSAGHLARAPIATTFTVVVMGLALALPLGLDVLVRNVRAATADFSGAVSISVFLKPGVAEARAAQLARSARERPGVAAVELITATQALAQFRAQSGFGAALDALDANPLPHALVVTPRPANSSPADMESLRRYLAAWPEVDAVQLDGDWVARFNALLALLRRALLVAAGFLALGVVAVVGNTIRLEIRNRRAEIEVTKLVGGTNGFVRRPFLYTGALYGLLGGLTAWLVVAVTLVLLGPTAARLAQSYGSPFVLAGPGARELGLLLGFGTLLGWIGSWLAAARHLARIEPGSG